MPPASRPSRSFGGLELRCPPLPHTLVEALDLMDHPERIETKTVTAVLERDPLVVARLLQTANSAYYGLQRTISSPERAVVMLGPVAVVGIVVGMSMLRLRSVLDGPAGACFSRLILHSIATAHLTTVLTEATQPAAPSRPARSSASYTAGLLHDFGKIILVYNFPYEAVALYDERSLGAQADDDRETERLLFGSDHTEAGEFAARKLRFPESLVQVIRHHHVPERAAPEAAPLVRTVAVANRAAAAMGHGFSGLCSWDDGLADPVWATYAEHTGRDLDEIAALLRAEQEGLDHYIETFAHPDAS